MITVRFTYDDPAGLWRGGDLADDLGPESTHPDAPPIRLLRMHRTGETLSLTDPYRRGVVEARFGETTQPPPIGGRVSDQTIDVPPAQVEAETEAEQAEAALPEQFEFAEWRLTHKGKPDSMMKLVERLEQTQVGRQLEAGRRLLAAHRVSGNGM